LLVSICSSDEDFRDEEDDDEKSFSLLSSSFNYYFASFSFTRSDESEFTNDDRGMILNEINSLFPSTIRFEDDGLYKCVIVFKAKNYVLYDGHKIKTKGSAIKATTKEPALREFINTIINNIIAGHTDYDSVYKKYVVEAFNIKDIKRWVSRKTISEKTLNPQRTNEQKIFDIIQDSNFSEGDRIYCFFREDGSLALAENFDGNYADTVYRSVWSNYSETVLTRPDPDTEVFKTNEVLTSEVYTLADWTESTFNQQLDQATLAIGFPQGLRKIKVNSGSTETTSATVAV
jgi:hypothetical protein